MVTHHGQQVDQMIDHLPEGRLQVRQGLLQLFQAAPLEGGIVDHDAPRPPAGLEERPGQRFPAGDDTAMGRGRPGPRPGSRTTETGRSRTSSPG